MSDDDALLDAIRRQPDDDLPRLVYADWLDEHGDPDRAEFIRTQIESARRPLAPERQAWDDRADDLLRRNADRWGAPFRPLGWDDHPPLTVSTQRIDHSSSRLVLFERGFGEVVRTDCDTLLRCPLHALRRLAPAPRLVLHRGSSEVDLAASARQWPFRELARSGVAEAVWAIELWGPMYEIGDIDLAEFSAEPALVARLEGLHLGETSVTAATVLPLLRSRHVRHLRSFYLEGHGSFGSPVIPALVAGKRDQQLETLKLWYHSIGAADVRRFCSNGCWPRLRCLELWHCGLDAFAASMLAATRFPELTSLTLCGNELTDAGARVLVSSPNFPRLQFLALGDNQITPDGWATITRQAEERFHLYGGEFGHHHRRAP